MDMSMEEVVQMLDSIEREGGGAWVDGGWAVDALVGRQTREHDEQVDVHRIAADGSYLMRNDETWRYPLPERETRGTIGGRRVRCLDAETQLLCHTGYEPLDLDRHRHDVALLESLRA